MKGGTDAKEGIYAGAEGILTPDPLERMAKINGVIPDRSLVTVDQRSVRVDGGATD